MKANSLLWGFVLLMAAGCTVHTPMEPTPLRPLPSRFSSVLTADNLGLDRSWWTVFGDAQLNRLMQRALEENLDLDLAFARLQQAQANLKGVQASLRPTFTAQADVSRSHGLTDITTETTGISLAAAWELDLWGKLRARKNAANQRLKASAQEVRGAYFTLSSQVADAYFLWQEQQAQLALTERTIASIKDSTERVERRYRAGLVDALDLYQARQNLASAQAARALRAQAVVEAHSTLALLTGRFPSEGPILSVVPLPQAAVPWEKGLSSELLLQRPDVAASALNLRALDHELAAAIADRLPAISLGGSIGRSRSSTPLTTLEGIIWNLFAQISAPVFDGGRRRAGVIRQRALVDEALASYRQTLLRAAKEVEDGLSAAQKLRERVGRLQQESVAADASLRLTTDNYFQGLTDYLDVLNAQRFQFDARRRLLSAQRQLVATHVSLARAVGGSWAKSVMEQRQQQNVSKGARD